MRGAFLVTAAAALIGSAVANVPHARRHGHDAFHHRRSLALSSSVALPIDAEATCGCTTYVTTIYGSPVPVPITTVTSQETTTISSTTSTTVTVVVTPTPAAPSSPPPQLPTATITSFTSTGTYTIPATTITVTDTTTVCGATTTELPSGTHTFGGVTTIVETSTTIICPYATVKPTGTTVTSVIETTTYICPSAGTYTIAPTTTFVPTSTVMVYPIPETFTPGTYTHPEQTVTATRTDFVYICPYTAASQPTSAPAPAPVAATPAASTPEASPAATTPASSPVLGSGDHMGITYTPYTNEGGCKPKDQVMSDIATAKSKGFTHIRVYSTDCSSLEFIGEACRQNGLMMIIGVFIKDTGIQGAQDQVQEIASWAQWDMVTLIVVGNEAIQSGYVSAGDLAGFIGSCKQTFTQAGYSGPVTTTEPINVWQQFGSTLCGAVDVLGANIHPFFNDAVSASNAGSFILEEVSVLKGVCNKQVINLETGWPSGGDANGDAVPSKENQRIALASIQKAYGGNSVFFSFSNDLWKSPGPFNAEQFWGCIEAF